MKTAIYIVDGVFQIVLTPESDFEKNCIQLNCKRQYQN